MGIQALEKEIVGLSKTLKVFIQRQTARWEALGWVVEYLCRRIALACMEAGPVEEMPTR